MNWFDAVAHCSGDWRLPNISELRSLFRSGDVTACQSTEWNMGWTEQEDIPAGYCGVWDDGCLGDGCRTIGSCIPSECDWDEARGCYWDAALSDIGECDYYWSSSQNAGDTDRVWVLNFVVGNVGDRSWSADVVHVRCVRSGP